MEMKLRLVLGLGRRWSDFVYSKLSCNRLSINETFTFVITDCWLDLLYERKQVSLKIDLM